MFINNVYIIYIDAGADAGAKSSAEDGAKVSIYNIMIHRGNYALNKM